LLFMQATWIVMIGKHPQKQHTKLVWSTIEPMMSNPNPSLRVIGKA